MSGTITFETRILSGADDVEQGTSGSVILNSSDLEMAVDRTVVQTVGLRFTRIDIPQGAIITSAYIQFQTEEVQTGTASLQIRGEDSDDAAAFTSASFNVSSRVKTDAWVNWTPDPWGTIGETALAQQTPNLAGIVQEIVSRSGWTPLNDIAFIVTGSGTRTAEAYEGGAAKAPLLHIEYMLPTGTEPAVGGISIGDVTVAEGNSGTTTATFTVTRTGGTAAFSVNYATSNGTATAGSDYVAKSGTLPFASGQATQTVSVTINGDTTIETNETFFVNLSGNTNITDGQGVGTIRNDDVASTGPRVCQIYDTTALGSPDPSGLAYVPGMGLFLCDSEVNESPFYGTANLFLLQPNGNQLTLLDTYNLMGFTIEPTGLTYAPSTDPSKDRLYISDDDADRVFWVDPDASLNSPEVKLGEFRTSLSGQTDAEDVAFDLMDGDVNGGDGHLYIANGVYANIREVKTDGTLVRTIALPSAISDPEALLWDDVHNVFFVGGKFSSNIWVLDRNGTILDTITLLGNYHHAGGGRAKVTDLEFAPSSDPNDGAEMSLYVADYGADQKNDGRLFEIDFSNYLWA